MATEQPVIHWTAFQPTWSNNADESSKSDMQVYFTWGSTYTVYHWYSNCVSSNSVFRWRISVVLQANLLRNEIRKYNFDNLYLHFFISFSILFHNQRCVCFRCKSPIIEFWFLEFRKKKCYLILYFKRFYFLRPK